jgi:L-asparaginase / beta-aspartyl-peptidase
MAPRPGSLVTVDKRLSVRPRSALLAFVAAFACAAAAEERVIALALHGGAGTLPAAGMTPERERAYRADLERALDAGYAQLERGAPALDAVVAAITILEDSELFNAGKGAVFTHDGRNELDAAVMDGATLRAGAVAGVHHVRNPIVLARLVMERSPHVLLTGAGAEEFALAQGVALVPADHFYTPSRWEELERARAADRGAAAAARDLHYGTVGVAALDRDGRLAAGTSTGGMTNKRWGRVGDSPLIGAGTYADGTVAVSATGTGEYFIRAAAAHDVSARMALGGRTVSRAVDEVLAKVAALGGDGGLVALDGAGRVAMAFNTEGMYRAYIDGAGERFVGIYRD